MGETPGTSLKLTSADHMFIWGFALLSLGVHFPFMLKGFGETDAANCAFYSFEWHLLGKPAFLSYMYRSSLLYLIYLRSALACGFMPAHLDMLMNVTSLVTGTLSCIPLYYLFRRLASQTTCILYMVILFFMPGFWLGHIYGMPHIPALVFLFAAVLFFDLFLCTVTRRRAIFLAAAFFCTVLALGLKLDLVLCTGSFAGLLMLRKANRFSNWISAAVLAVLPLSLIVLLHKTLFPEYPDVYDFSQEWNRSFPFTPTALLDIENLAASACALGIVFTLCLAASLLFGLIRKQNLSLLVFLLCWSLPPILFWGLKMGNSARHMTIPLVPLLFYFALMMKELLPVHGWRMAGVTAIILLNYFVCPDNQLSRTVRPSSRLFKAANHIQNAIEQRHALGTEFASDPSSQKVIAGNDYIVYVLWESTKDLDHFTYGKSGALSYVRNEIACLIKAHHSSSGIDLEEIKSLYPDWKIWVWEQPDNMSMPRLISP